MAKSLKEESFTLQHVYLVFSDNYCNFSEHVPQIFALEDKCLILGHLHVSLDGKGRSRNANVSVDYTLSVILLGACIIE